jgi:DNA segregation ATPase FtsK/SpoIIIE, S-DNA-T family
VTSSPDWAETLSDIAQRGRSLGIHVVLSSQRITGVLPRALMANVSMRICGRVSDDQEVIEWMPDVSPAHKNTLRHVSPGRVLVAGATSTPAWHEVALGNQWAMEHTGDMSTWRVWAEELPHLVPWKPGVWGWGDYPETQTQHPLTRDPLLDGSVLVVGDSSSGRTSAAWALASLSSVAVAAPLDPAGVWACMSELHGTGATLVIDNADQVLHRCGSEAEVFLMDALEGFDGKLILVTSPRHRLSRGLARLATQRLVLSLAQNDDQVQWGGPGATVPGRGVMGGVEVQVSYPAEPIPLWQVPAWDPGGSDPIVLTETPRAWEGYPTRFLGTPEQAMATWQTLGPLVNDGDVVLQGINYRDARLISAGRIVLPPLSTQPDSVWVWRAGRALLARPTGRERSLL